MIPKMRYISINLNRLRQANINHLESLLKHKIHDLEIIMFDVIWFNPEKNKEELYPAKIFTRRPYVISKEIIQQFKSTSLADAWLPSNYDDIKYIGRNPNEPISEYIINIMKEYFDSASHERHDRNIKKFYSKDEYRAAAIATEISDMSKALLKEKWSDNIGTPKKNFISWFFPKYENLLRITYYENYKLVTEGKIVSSSIRYLYDQP